MVKCKCKVKCGDGGGCGRTRPDSSPCDIFLARPPLGCRNNLPVRTCLSVPASHPAVHDFAGVQPSGPAAMSPMMGGMQRIPGDDGQWLLRLRSSCSWSLTRQGSTVCLYHYLTSPHSYSVHLEWTAPSWCHLFNTTCRTWPPCFCVIYCLEFLMFLLWCAGLWVCVCIVVCMWQCACECIRVTPSSIPLLTPWSKASGDPRLHSPPFR